MGLLFKLKIDLKDSKGPRLSLASTKRKIAMGGSFIFGGVFLAIMTFAALPLFKLLWEQGGIFDNLIVLFFASALILYPILVFICLGFEDRSILTHCPEKKTWTLQRYKKVLFFKYQKEELHNLKFPEDFSIENWKGSLNSAALHQNPDARQKQYATKGHWLLVARDKAGNKITLERRAKKEDVEWLHLLIEQYFAKTL